MVTFSIGVARDRVPARRITWQLGRRRWLVGKVARVLRDGGRSRKGRRVGGGRRSRSRPGGDEPGPYLLGDRGRPSRRPAPRERTSEGFPGEAVRPGAAAVEERRSAPELTGARERPAWAPSCLRLGYCSSPGSRQVSLGTKWVSPWARGDRKPLLPGLAELVTGRPVEAWAALWQLLAQAPGGAGTGSSFCLWEPVVFLFY